MRNKWPSIYTRNWVLLNSNSNFVIWQRTIWSKCKKNSEKIDIAIFGVLRPPPQSRILILNFCINLPNYIKSQSIRPTDSNVGYPWTFWNVSAAHSICLSVAIWWLVKFRTEHIGQRSYIQFSFTTFVGRSVTKVSIWWVTYIDPELLIDLHVKSLTFVGEFAKLQNATVRSVVSVRLSVQMKRPTSRWTDFMKLDIWLFSANLSRKFKFH